MMFIFQMGRPLVSLMRIDFIKKNTNRSGYRLTSPSGEYEFKASSQHPRNQLCGDVSRHGGPKWSLTCHGLYQRSTGIVFFNTIWISIMKISHFLLPIRYRYLRISFKSRYILCKNLHIWVHNIIQSHNNVLRDWHNSEEYFSHSNWIWRKLWSIPQNTIMTLNNIM